MSFDFAVNPSDEQNQTTKDNDNEATPDFASNEVGDLYLSIGDWKATLGAMLPEIPIPDGANYTKTVEDDDGNEKEVLKALKIYSDDTLEDVSRLLGKYDDAHPQQKLHMVASLAKSTAGKMQGSMNDHPIGLRDGEAPEEHFEESFSYALHSIDLPTIEWDDLDGGERESLEEMGVNPSELGFDPSYGGPKIPSIAGQRLPIAVEEGNEVMEALELLQQLPDEPSHWDEDDGLVEATESVEETSEKVPQEDREVNLARSPEAIKSFNVGEIRSGVTDITNLRSIQTMLRVEQESDNPRSSAVQRLKERRNALQNGDDEESASDNEVADSVEDVEVESEEDGEWTEADKNLMRTLVETGQAEDLEEAKDQIRSL